MFVGRKIEMDFLNEKYMNPKSEFVIIYGRRRIGKTELLKQFVKDKKHVFYYGHQVTDSMQLKRITGVVTEHFGKKIYSDSFDLWESVFQYISENLQNDEKTVIVLDEFPYIVEGNMSIPSVMQSAWDHYLIDKNIMIILCGSSMSFMEKEVLSEKNPLYGRATGIYKMGEMDFESTKAFYSATSIEQQVAYFSVFSGVPYYLGLIDANKSFKDNIIGSILRNGSVLFNEVEFLLKQELREVSVYNAIITAIALGRTKQNDIVQLTGIEKTKLSYYLNSLIDIGIVRKEYPSTIKAKEMPKSRMGLYMIDNSFFRFYYRFVYPYLSEIVDGNAEIIYDEIIDKQLSDFVGIEFEKIAIENMKKLNSKGLLPIKCVKIGRWWNKQTEIDIVGYDSHDNYIFGECKWRNDKVGISTLSKLRDKSISFDSATAKYFILYSKSGFTEELVNLAKQDNHVLLINEY